MVGAGVPVAGGVLGAAVVAGGALEEAGGALDEVAGAVQNFTSQSSGKNCFL